MIYVQYEARAINREINIHTKSAFYQSKCGVGSGMNDLMNKGPEGVYGKLKTFINKYAQHESDRQQKTLARTLCMSYL